MTPRLSKPVSLSLAESKLPEIDRSVHGYLYTQLLQHQIVLDVIMDDNIDTPEDLDSWLPHPVTTKYALRMYYKYPKRMTELVSRVLEEPFEDEVDVLQTAAVMFTEGLFMELLRESLLQIRRLDIGVEIWESEEQRLEARSILGWDYTDESFLSNRIDLMQKQTI